MHGVVMSGLQSFVREEMGSRAWKTVRESAGVDRTTYSRVRDYPDGEFEDIYGVLIEEYDLDETRLQRQFGQYLFDSLSDIYGGLYFDDDWDALDMIDNVEETIHQSLKRRDDATFTPPELETDRTGDDEVVVRYGSDRHLCDLARGIVMGVATYYETWLEVDEPTCMKDGDDVCRLEVTRLSD